MALLSASGLSAQQGGFQETIEGGHSIFGVIASADGRALLLISRAGVSVPTLQFVAGYEPGAAEQAATNISTQGGQNFHLPLGSRLLWLNGHTLFASLGGGGSPGCMRGFSRLDTDTGEGWQICLNDSSLIGIHRALTASDSSDVYLVRQSGPGMVFYRVTQEGIPVGQGYLNFPLQSDTQRRIPVDAVFSDDLDAVVVVGRGDFPLDEGFLMKLSASGEVAVLKDLGGFMPEAIIPDGEGGFYLLGRTQRYSAVSGNRWDMAIIRMDGDLDLVWSKVYSAGQFDFSRVAASAVPGGGLAVAYATSGAFPTILARLSAGGDILWQRGYPLYTPLVDVFPDGSLLLATPRHFDANGQIFLKTIVAKTDPEGLMPDCPVFPSCLVANDIAIDLDTFVQAEIIPFPLSSSLQLLVTSDTTLASAPFCDLLPPPDPVFALPDTVCMGSVGALTHLASQNANGTFWEVVGPSVDTAWADVVPEGLPFTLPGSYIVRQTAWALGCTQQHMETVLTVDSLVVTATIEADTECLTLPAPIQLEGSRPIREVTWHPVLVQGGAPLNGVYTATVSDGHCTATASVEVVSPLEGLHRDSLLLLPADTTVCRASLPWRVTPTSAYAATFTLGGVAGTTFGLPDAGVWTFEATVQGCTFRAPFQLGVEACPPAVYIPDVFSPNDDGINDTFSAFGPHHRVLSLRVFDRWGGLLWQGAGTDAWKGTAAGHPVPVGHYVYVLEYEDTRTRAREVLSGGVLLVR